MIRGVGRLVAPYMTGLASSAGPLAATEYGALAIETGIRCESIVREQQRLYDELLGIGGVATRGDRRSRGELALRRAMAPDRPVSGAGVPEVFWHGPDRVASDRPTVVLINGWTAPGAMWPEGLVAGLETRYDVIRIDNRGTGYSRTAPSPFTIGDLADDVAEVIEAVGADEAVLVGLSMGGMIAQETAIRHPELVRGLVLCGTRAPSPAAFLPAGDILQSTLARPAPSADIRRLIAWSWSSLVGPGFADEHPDVIDEIVEQVLARPTPRAAVLTQARAISAWHGSWRLRRITAPTTVIHGANDPLIPVGNGMRIAQLIPGAVYVELPGVGHIVTYETPDAVLAAVSRVRS